jgi:predicted nucleic acid-binding protein
VIVVDTNVIAYLYLPNEHTQMAEQLLAHDPEWAAPLLWRSELRNVLALYVRQQLLDLDGAYAIQTEAESLVAGREYDVGSLDVLTLACSSGCSAYDCEFVALARHLNTRLVTVDQQLVRRFKSTAVSLRRSLQ